MMRDSSCLIRTWATLMILSGAGTALALMGEDRFGWAVGLAALGLAFAKARLVLLHYLRLSQAPSWRGGAIATVGAAVVLFAVLFLAG